MFEQIPRNITRFNCLKPLKNITHLTLISIVTIVSGYLIFIDASTSNIVVVMVDDLDVDTFNILLENKLMPHLKKDVVDNGTTFTNAFVTNSICCPSRSTFLTGLYSHNHNVTTNAALTGILQFNDTDTLPVWLQSSGYKTGFIGKYLTFYGEAT